MTLRILGASHANALRFSYELEHQNHPADLQIRGLAALNNFHSPFHSFDGKEIRFTNPEIANGFKIGFGVDKITAADQVWGVVAGFSSVRIWGAWFWGQGYSVSDAKKPAKFHLSRSIINQLNQLINGHWMQFLADLRQLGIRVILISAPPPMLVHPSFENRGDPDIAIMVSKIVEDHWQDFCNKHEIDALLVPEHLLDTRGFLLPKYVVDDGKEDWTHGNLQYGAQMLAEVLKIF